MSRWCTDPALTVLRQRLRCRGSGWEAVKAALHALQDVQGSTGCLLGALMSFQAVLAGPETLPQELKGSAEGCGARAGEVLSSFEALMTGAAGDGLWQSCWHINQHSCPQTCRLPHVHPWDRSSLWEVAFRGARRCLGMARMPQLSLRSH